MVDHVSHVGGSRFLNLISPILVSMAIIYSEYAPALHRQIVHCGRSKGVDCTAVKIAHFGLHYVRVLKLIFNQYFNEITVSDVSTFKIPFYVFYRGIVVRTAIVAPLSLV